ncbi:hypothetical protein GCM10010455_14120 [Microbacterium esteraromaticum]
MPAGKRSEVGGERMGRVGGLEEHESPGGAQPLTDVVCSSGQLCVCQIPVVCAERYGSWFATEQIH